MRLSGGCADGVRPLYTVAPKEKWVADLTYVWTTKGWLFAAAVLDLYSRRVVGWSMQATMTTQLVTDALTMESWRRGARTALHHSDQGSPPEFNWSSQRHSLEWIEETDRTLLQFHAETFHIGEHQPNRTRAGGGGS